MNQDQLNKRLFEAARDNITEAVKKALEDGADVNAKNKNSYSPLHFAARWGNTDIATMLIEKGADVNVRVGVNGITPLHRAAIYENKETAKLLMEKGADVNARDENGITPLHRAVLPDYINIELVNLLIDCGGRL